jgi:hypothetical protein
MVKHRPQGNRQHEKCYGPDKHQLGELANAFVGSEQMVKNLGDDYEPEQKTYAPVNPSAVPGPIRIAKPQQPVPNYHRDSGIDDIKEKYGRIVTQPAYRERDRQREEKSNPSEDVHLKHNPLEVHDGRGENNLITRGFQ